MIISLIRFADRTPLLEFGTFRFDFRVEQIPEPSTTINLELLG
ncbi:hypothetical protein [Nostoc sp. MS1]|nr:hypothetical protein [Nostoc sp. MS1]